MVGNGTIIGVQEPPQDKRIFNRRQPCGTFKPISEFFDEKKPEPLQTENIDTPCDGGCGTTVKKGDPCYFNGVRVLCVDCGDAEIHGGIADPTPFSGGE